MRGAIGRQGAEAMSAPNPSSTDRDLESLRRAQRAHEPSMEEILASIRSIIADDREPPAASAPAPKAGSAAGPQIVYTNNAVPPARPVASTPEAAPPSPAPAVAAPSPKVVWEKPEPAAEPAPAAQPAAAAAPDAPAPGSNAAPAEEEPFASPETEAVVAASFQALSASVAMQSTAMIENLTREMLRPMLKSWLDDNLPAIVERLVRAEIQRVARGAR